MATLSEIFTNIANAIRNKRGKTATMTPAAMVTEIGTLVKPSTTKGATTYTPTTSNQTIAAGTYCSGVQTIKGDANLVAENIKSGVNIFGVEGSLEAAGSGGNITGSDCPVTIINNTPYAMTIGGIILSPASEAEGIHSATIPLSYYGYSPAFIRSIQLGILLHDTPTDGYVASLSCNVDGITCYSNLAIFDNIINVGSTTQPTYYTVLVSVLTDINADAVSHGMTITIE